jgi:Glucosyl transferase GtrII
MKSFTLGLIGLRGDIIRFRWALIAATVIALIARAQAITEPMYSVDGYAFLNRPEEWRTLLMANGRWGLVALLWLQTQIGYAGMGVVPSALILSTVCFVGAAFLYARILLTKIELPELLIFLTLFTLHPYNTEFFTFSDATLGISLPIFLAAVALACMESTVRPWRGAVLGGVFMVIALSIYQLALAHAVVVCLLSIVRRIANSDPSQARGRRWRLLIVSPPVRSLLTVVLAFVVLLLMTIAISRFSGIALARRAELSFSFPDFWPGAGSVVVTGSLGVVCLPE